MESKGVKDKLTVINPGGVNGDALDDKKIHRLNMFNYSLKENIQWLQILEF